MNRINACLHVLTNIFIMTIPMAPIFIFVSLIKPYLDVFLYSYTDILPFVLFYTFLMVGIFYLQGFGHINNPYKLTLLGMLFSILGNIAVLAGLPYHVCWELGAVLMGIGLSIAVPMYQTTQDELTRQRHWPYKENMKRDAVLRFLFVIINMVIAIVSVKAVLIFYLLLLVSCGYFICHLPVTNKLHFDPIFVPRSNSSRYYYLIIAFLLLFLTFFVRLLKQTANVTYFIYMGIAFAIFMVMLVGMRRHNIHLYSLQTSWFSEVTNFVILFTVIYYISMKEFIFVFYTMAVFMSGACLIPFMRPITMRLTKYCSLVTLCNISSILFLLLLFSSNVYIYMTGVFLCAFSNIQAIIVLRQNFMDEMGIHHYEKRLIQAKMRNLGSIGGQTIMMFIIIAGSWFETRHGSLALASYISRDGTITTLDIFDFIKLLCITAIILEGLWLLYISHTRDGESTLL